MRIKILSFLSSLFYFLGVLFSNNVVIVKKHIEKNKQAIIENSKNEVKERIEQTKKSISFENAKATKTEKKKEVKKAKK